ncbi:MAG: hypothetical protein GSR84_05685 [Desulfurococcales archaeon]|nr:hypothetical protein [Desulfurococcales archaeon]
MAGRSFERLKYEALEKRIRMLEEELERVKRMLRVAEMDLEEASGRLAILVVKLEDIKCSLEGG